MVAKAPAPAAEASARARLERAAGEDFEIGELIGSGGFADVFRATDRRLKRSVAIKVLRADVHATPDAVERFRREAESVAALRHPHILPIHAIGERDDVVWLVLDHVTGEPLDRWLEREPVATVEETTRIVSEIAAALGAAHRAGIAHRDVKPANVLLDGVERRVLLTDFGIARAMAGADHALTRTGTFVGTPHYLSPEQAAGDVADPRADLYSLGVLAYRMLTGALPFDGTIASVLVQHLTKTPRPIRELRPECPAGVADAISRCLEKSPEERWQSSDELIAALSARSNTVAVGPDSRHAPLEASSEGAPSEVHAARFRRTVLLSAVVASGSIVLDAVLTRGFTFSALVLLVCAAGVALAAGRHLVAGRSPLALLRRSVAIDASSTEEFGRHANAVRRARAERTAIVRALADLSHVERDRLAGAAAVADQLVARAVQIARRMSTLDERIGVERGRDVQRSPSRPTRMLAEMHASRTRLDAELAEAEQALASLRDVTQRADAAETGATRLELARVLARAERCLRSSPDAESADLAPLRHAERGSGEQHDRQQR